MTLHKAEDFKNFHVSGLLLNLKYFNYLYGCIQIMCIQINVPGESPLIYRNLQWLIFMWMIKHEQALVYVKIFTAQKILCSFCTGKIASPKYIWEFFCFEQLLFFFFPGLLFDYCLLSLSNIQWIHKIPFSM